MNIAYQKIWQQLLSYQAEILGYLKRSVEDGELARDLFQEVYYQALVHLPELNADRSLKNWLFTVARNKVINFFRDQGRRKMVDFKDQLLDDASQNGTFDSEAVQFALQALPERQKKILLLREIEGFNYRQLAKALDLSEAAVTSLLKRARDNFKKHYQLFFLPDWLKKEASQLPIEDLLRFVKPEVTDVPILQNLMQRSQQYFSTIKGRWNTVREQFFSHHHLQHILQYLPDLSQKVVLDAGSATGMVAINCALKAQQVVALDLNQRFIQYLQNLKNILMLHALSVIRGDLKKTPFKPRKFDLIFTVLVLHHLPQPQKWFKDASELLKKGGHLIIVEFERHHDKQLADTMHDLWLGFAPSLIERWAQLHNLKVNFTDSWISKPGLPVRWYLLKK